MAELSYTTRGIRRRRNTDKWEITLSHRNPITGEQIRTFHTVEAKTLKQAERKRDALILDLERKGSAYEPSWWRGESAYAEDGGWDAFDDICGGCNEQLASWAY